MCFAGPSMGNSAEADQMSPDVSSLLNIYILHVAALDETIIPSCLHFSMQNIEQSRGYAAPLGGVTSTSTNIFLCLLTFV